jgi:hypothetical protein
VARLDSEIGSRAHLFLLCVHTTTLSRDFHFFVYPKKKRAAHP